MSVETEARAEAERQVREKRDSLWEEHGEHLNYDYAQGFERGFPVAAVWAIERVTPEQVRNEIAGHQIGSGYYATAIGVDEAQEIAADIIALYRGEEA